MSESPEARARRRWITFGELIALAALIVSALGVWIAWKSSSKDEPTRIVEQRSTVPLALRGKAEDDGRRLTISPVESSHALESLTLTIKGAYPIELGSDGTVDADTVQRKLTGTALDKGAHSITVRVEARYVEMGKDRHAGGAYTLRYRVEGGGILGGRSLRLVGLSR
jgi:hypothetical protein